MMWKVLICIFASLLGFAGPLGAQEPSATGEPALENAENGEVPEYTSITSYLAPFIYRGQGQRDPFRPPEIAIPMVQGDLYGPFLPLQRFRIEDLVLKGLFWNIENPKALVQDPKGVTHRVGIKDYIGENFGYVASIREKELVIIQTLEEGGQRYSTTKVMFFKNTRSR